MAKEKKLKKFRVSFEVARVIEFEAESREKAIEIAEKRIKESGEKSTTNLVLDEITK